MSSIKQNIKQLENYWYQQNKFDNKAFEDDVINGDEYLECLRDFISSRKSIELNLYDSITLGIQFLEINNDVKTLHTHIEKIIENTYQLIYLWIPFKKIIVPETFKKAYNDTVYETSSLITDAFYFLNYFTLEENKNTLIIAKNKFKRREQFEKERERNSKLSLDIVKKNITKEKAKTPIKVINSKQTIGFIIQSLIIIIFYQSIVIFFELPMHLNIIDKLIVIIAYFLSFMCFPFILNFISKVEVQLPILFLSFCSGICTFGVLEHSLIKGIVYPIIIWGYPMYFILNIRKYTEHISSESLRIKTFQMFFGINIIMLMVSQHLIWLLFMKSS